METDEISRAMRSLAQRASDIAGDINELARDLVELARMVYQSGRKDEGGEKDVEKRNE